GARLPRHRQLVRAEADVAEVAKPDRARRSSARCAHAIDEARSPRTRVAARDAANGGGDVEQVGGAAIDATGRAAGRPDQQWNADRRLVRQHLAVKPVVAEQLAVIGREDDPGLLVELRLLDRREHAADAVVDE